MKKNLLKKTTLILTAAVLCGTYLMTPRTSYAETENILYGSWFDRVTNHAGSVIEFQVNGASGISFDVSDYESFCFQVDGGEPQKVAPGWYKLSSGKHEVCLYTESIADRKTGVTFNAANLNGGSFSPSTKEQYLFIGDSLWEGTNILVTEKYPNDKNKTYKSSFTNSIPFNICKNMNTVPVTVAAPGSGVVMTEIFTTVEDMAFKNGINAKPTKIFISVGTNDMKLGIPNHIERAEMQHLVDTTKKNFPDSQIYMLVPFYGQCYFTPITELTGVTVIDTHGWPIEYTDGIHPTAESAKFAADVITYILQNPTVKLNMDDFKEDPAEAEQALPQDGAAQQGQTAFSQLPNLAAPQDQTGVQNQTGIQNPTLYQYQTMIPNQSMPDCWTYIQDPKVTRMQERFLEKLKNYQYRIQGAIMDPE